MVTRKVRRPRWRSADISSYQRRAKLGARWLDERYPGWAEQIDVERLQMVNDAQCIGGQLGIHWAQLGLEFECDTGYEKVGIFSSADGFWRKEVRKRQTPETPETLNMDLGDELRELEVPAPVDVPTELPQEQPEREQEEVPELVPA